MSVIKLQGMPGSTSQVDVGPRDADPQHAGRPAPQGEPARGPPSPPRIQDLDPLEDVASESGASGGATVTEPVDATPPQDPVERRKVIMRIAGYAKSRLAKYMPPMPTLGELEVMSVEQLQDLLRDIQYSVNIGQNQSNVEQIAQIGVTAIENLACRFTPLKLKGFADNCMANEAFLDNIAELSLLYQDYAYVSPEKRILLTLAKSALVTHQINSALQETDGARSRMAEPVSADVAQRYSDL